MHGSPYTDEQDYTIRRLFRAGADDASIAVALGRSGRRCGPEAVRKRRRHLGLKKSPTYVRWQWSATFDECRA